MDKTLGNPRSTFVGLKARLMAMADGMTVSTAGALQSLVTLFASMLRARYSMSNGQTLVIAAPVSATFVQAPSTSFCHWNVTGPVAFVTPALTTLDWLCVTTDGENAAVTDGCTTCSPAAALHALVALKLSTARTRYSTLAPHARVMLAPVSGAATQSTAPARRHSYWYV